MFEKKYKIQNTRKFKRLKADYLIKYQLASSEEEAMVANIKDISAGGVKFWSERFLQEGALLRLSVLVPALDRTIHALGRVIRVRQAAKGPIYYLSVAFLEIPKLDQIALNDFVERLSATHEAWFFIDDAPVVTRRAEWGAPSFSR